MNYIEISVRTNHTAAEAVSQILVDLGAKGTVVDDPLLINYLRANGGWQLTDIPEQHDTETVTVTAYYPENALWQEQLQKINAELLAIEKRIGKFRYGDLLFRTVSEEDWANEWKRYFHVTHVGERLVIRPSWENYTPAAGEKVITIDPGMAFGTGTHHTTNMCMARLEKIVKPGMKVFDVGTGSGILAIAAALLGAGNIKAVDIDAVAVRVAGENIANNGLDCKIDVRVGDLLHGTEGKADLIIANIIADIVIQLIPDVAVKLNPGGTFLASGIIEERAGDVERAAMEKGLKLSHMEHRGGWVVMEFGMA
ncbi:MAG: 50S ribosomal protein L11 methyltransferase [Acidaminococcaceae bacterium]|nr:50S ribosomal protein L11 methyltransferase [Acidaminococcaceae bacterium]